METNVFAHEKPDGYGRGTPSTELLRLFLWKLPLLKAIIVHGKVAAQLVERIEQPAHLHRWTTKQFRFVSYAEIDEIAALIANLLPQQSTHSS